MVAARAPPPLPWALLKQRRRPGYKPRRSGRPIGGFFGSLARNRCPPRFGGQRLGANGSRPCAPPWRLLVSPLLTLFSLVFIVDVVPVVGGLVAEWAEDYAVVTLHVADAQLSG